MATEPPAWRIALSDLDYGPEEEEAVLKVLRSKWLTMGAVVREFEQAFAREIGVRHAIAVSSGTDALLLSLLSLEIGTGHEVVQPAVNFVAAANVTIRLGARPVFVDIRSLDDPTIDPDDLARRLTPDTRAVIVMHYGGAPCQMDKILLECRARGVAVIEDACHGVGGSHRGRKMGAWGDLAAFSFFSNKNMATGEGGMVTTDRDDLAARVRSLRSHGMTTVTWDRHHGHAATYDVTAHGLNCRMDELRAALGLAQLKKLARNNARRSALACNYHRLWREEFPDLARRGWSLPPLGVDSDGAAHHLMIALAPDAATRARAMEHLKTRGIQTSIHYPLIPDFAAFREGQGAEPDVALDRSRDFCARELTLPLHPLMSESDVRQILVSLAELDECKW
jgi:dTDP-4-amino-4,6-dideoxygalactose transaminase